MTTLGVLDRVFEGERSPRENELLLETNSDTAVRECVVLLFVLVNVLLFEAVGAVVCGVVDAEYVVVAE